MFWRGWWAMQAATRDPRAGFTLVEMLIAIAILGIILGVAYRVLDTMLATRDRVSEEYRRWRDVARAVAWIERDLDALQARPIRDQSDRLAAALVGSASRTPAEQAGIAFTRSGDPEEGGRGAAPRRVGYRVHDGALERLSWRVLDQAPRSTPTATAILTGVAGLGVRYRDAQGQWQQEWSRPTLPTALNITIRLATGERITRVIAVQAGVGR
jgi:general secretion pathway protein J